MKKLYSIAIILGLMIMVTGCRSSRHASRTSSTADVPTDVTTGASVKTSTTTTTPTTPSNPNDQSSPSTQKTPQTNTQKTNVEALSAKLALTLRYGSNKIKLSGTYRLKRNDVVQINLTYQLLFIPINVGTLELTPEYILFLDRYNKRFCRIAYDKVPSLASSGIGFDYFQRIFWGEAEKSSIPMFDWNYSNWQPLGDGKFPTNIEFSMKLASESYRATFELSNITVTDNWPTRTTVSSEFIPITLDTALKALMKIAK